MEEALLLSRCHVVDPELAPRQLTSPNVLPGQEIRPGERTIQRPEKPCHVVGFDAAKAGVVHVGRVVARRR